jgi:excisionase family DNA binding protein
MPALPCAILYCVKYFTVQTMMPNTFIARLAQIAFPQTSQNLSLSFDEAARVTGVSQRTLRRLADRGQIKTAKLGSRRVVSYESLKQLVG